MQVKDETVGQILRALIRQEVAAELERRGGGTVVVDPPPRDLPPGAGAYALAPFAEQVLREAGQPLHVRELAGRMVRQGFRHRRRPKYSDQLERSLNSLASPSQHPEIFVRAGARTLGLRNF
jgi:2-polyprenyl-6-methoxyphenol hydroxylase-like FAD-dependent oxidoreductase